jgi:peptidoglycan/xylan/chitin deacetylase (PgdA/CDA1 family)
MGLTSAVRERSSAATAYRILAVAIGLALGSALFVPQTAVQAADSKTPDSAVSGRPAADNGAVTLMYQRFGESGFPASNITLEQLDAHITELTSGAYNLLPLSDVVAALRDGRALPDRSVAITIDDAYLSAYREAWPRLKTANLPFTLFVSTDVMDRGYPDFMTWDQLRELAAHPNVTVGLHGSKHGHMIEALSDANRQEITRSSQKLRDELGKTVKLFAYPYGEYSSELVEIAREAGFEAAFGQQSGAISRNDDLFTLPRFPLSETYGGLDRFRLTVNSLALPATDVTPGDLLLTPASNPPAYGFTVGAEVTSLNGLQCYTGNHEVLVEQLGADRVEVRIDSPLQPGRRRINCTLPGPDRRWRWLGRQFYVPRT